MRRTRALWYSILFVTALVAGSVALFTTGIRPVLGLDLEGGVSVVLSAPDDTPDTVMDQALENIRARIDAFGTAEPLLFVTGTNIEVQLPGLARGTVEQRPKSQSCLFGTGESPFACFDQEPDGQAELEAAAVEPIDLAACLNGLEEFGEDPPCLASEEEATAAIDAITVEEVDAEFCLVGTGLAEDLCRPTEAEAEEALASIGVDVTQTFCLQGTADEPLRNELGAACYPTQGEADDQLAALELRSFEQEFCVISSAEQNLGCFLTRDLAEARLQETGQDRLLTVIGQTARLEFRPVLPAGTISPGTPEYDELPVDCATQAEIESDACSFDVLRDEEVTFLHRDGETKYRLGPVELTGDAIDRATAVLDTGGGVNVGGGWQISFDTTGEGAGQWAEVTQRLQGQQLAIVVDRQVISAPTVQDPITNGTGIISGSFTEARAKDLATQLNAGALPVELATEQVVTVSPTLGKESLDAGILAGIGGLILLALYLLFYYRILALVAWLGMTIWGVLAFALIAVAGRSVGYNLTLAGVAGLVISLGVTADSYIVFFERFKDEVHAGRSPRTAVQPAFTKAFRTIVAADIVTALAAIVLYLTAISSVRGFALTLGVSVLLDLFVVYFFKRPAVFLLARNERLVTMRGVGVISGLAADREALPAVSGGSR